VCEKGLCVSNCSCRGCEDGSMCGADGRCVDTACATKMCAAGTVCKAGECIDPCAGVVCPGGGMCSQGTCSAPMGTGTGATGTGANGSVDFGGGTGIPFGGAPNGTGNVPNDGQQPSKNVPQATAKGCGCRVAGDTDRTTTRLAWLSALVGLGVVLKRRRAARA